MVILIGLTVVGCGTKATTSASTVITSAPTEWATLENTSVRLLGTAGNSRGGPFLRLEDRSVVFLTAITPWSIDTVSRPIGVDGSVVRGEGEFEGKYVVRVKSWWVQGSTNVPQKGAAGSS